MVDLPAPDSPIRPSTSPLLTLTSTLSTMTLPAMLSSRRPLICKMTWSFMLGFPVQSSAWAPDGRASMDNIQSTTRLIDTVNKAIVAAGYMGAIMPKLIAAAFSRTMPPKSA